MTPKPPRRRTVPLKSSGLLVLLALLAMTGCREPPPTDRELPPEPQAQHTELRDGLQVPVERARQVEAETLKAAEAQRAAIDAASD